MLYSPVQCVFTAVFALALLLFAENSTAQDITPATRLYDVVPNCAYECIETFIQLDYPESVCSRRTDIDCLCRTNTTSGLTFGEGALSCIFSFCRQQVQSSLSVYGICDPVPGALPKTHATITATVPFVNPPTTTAQTGGPGDGPGLTSTSFSNYTRSHTTTKPVRTSAIIASSQSSATRSSHSVSSTSASTTAREPSHTPESAHSLNSGAVIGISVASGISFAFIVGVVVFFCFKRYKGKRQAKKDPDFFEIGGVMSEPPDFSLPSTRRPTPGPQPPFSSINRDQEGGRAITPYRTVGQNPAVVITKPDHDTAGYDSPGRIGLAVSSDSEFEDSSKSQASPRTLSDLLPDKPDLYPGPLRVSRQNNHRPSSGETLFEDDTIPLRQRSITGHSSSWTDWSGSTSKEYGNVPCNRMRMVGLPPNPRAPKQGFGGIPLNTRGPSQRSTPPYAIRGIQPGYGVTGSSSQTSLTSQMQLSDRENYTARYWQDSDNIEYGSDLNRPFSHNATLPQLPSSMASCPYPEKPGSHLEIPDINGNRQSSGWVRNSGVFRPLTPVTEIRTPANNAQERTNHDYFSSSPVRYPTVEHPTPHPVNEIVSRPRIVRQDDIKRVQIRKGKPQPKELQVPYSPEDYWLEHSRSQTPAGRYEMYSGRNPAVPNPMQRLPPLEHNLTPSRRGADLILRVD
ncbi:hypothetical protein PHISCL_06486 [Aspergillus sclerotialis]|uniref:CFEM domain-containing protein n=1 Tax=Aspergillus sclerotialis TaxID=2070753 RepID=A0A3A2ZDG2_9EURO|nr:hypothetical protein PHISCL_06486 [Aspergillus sclerotialis]